MLRVLDRMEDEAINVEEVPVVDANLRRNSAAVDDGSLRIKR